MRLLLCSKRLRLSNHNRSKKFQVRKVEISLLLGDRELRGLHSSVNYDVRRSVSCRNTRERVLMLSS
jgi:hypothetical protein